MAAAAPPPVRPPSGLPTPRSPTLSDFGMILPEADSLRTVSPSPYTQRPPSPPTFYAHANRSERTIRLAAAPHARRGPSPHSKTSPLSSQSSRSTLRTMADSDGSAHSKGSSKSTLRRNSPRRDETLASSPILGDALASGPANEWAGQRRLSNASSSIHSEDLENLRWPGFDSSDHFDDSGVVLEEEDDGDGEERDESPADTRQDDHAEPNPWDAQADDEFSSAALSRRAELILANAKKRLNVMEGNLRGARESLVISPTSLQTDLQRQLAAARERDRKLYAGIGPIPPRTRPNRFSLLSTESSSTHSRGLSETSVPISFMTPYNNRSAASKRSSSAMGTSSGPWSPEGFGQGRFPIRESRSFEVMRDPRNNGWGSHEEHRSSRSHESRGSRSPPMGLETLPEDDDQRPASTTGDLRSQMDSLKGRISSLRQRAKEDHMRRRSMQSLRTPSPFTSAETWYAEGDAYRSGAPIAADAGVGLTSTPPARKTLQEEEEETISSTPKKNSRETSPAHGKAKQAKEQAVHEWQESASHAYMPPDVKDPEGPQAAERELEDDEDDLDDDHDFVSVDGGDYDQGSGSVYEDAVYDMPVAERHEDRVDAFDYENFFLHSAMGTYSSANRRSSTSSTSSTSSSSADSVATTRPVTVMDMRAPAADTPGKRSAMHRRNSSLDSVSTVATFATATEGPGDGDTDSLPGSPLSPNPRLHPVQPPSPPRPDSACNMRNPPAAAGGAAMLLGLQTSKMYGILLEPLPGEDPRLALSEDDKQLLYGLAARLQSASAALQRAGAGRAERAEWRARLEGARRLLGGEDV